MKYSVIAAILSCWAASAQQPAPTVPGEPLNLFEVKKQLIAYHACAEPNCYAPQIERQIDMAIDLLKQSVANAKEKKKLALVLDIDETSLSNWAVEMLDDFGYIPADSNSCVTLQCGKAIPGTLRLFHEAENANVAVFFITGRPESQRKATEANLNAEGFDRWEHIYLRSQDSFQTETVTQFKSGARREIEAMKYRIVLNVGDQLSDLAGEPQADHSVKLPNPFYYIK